MLKLQLFCSLERAGETLHLCVKEKPGYSPGRAEYSRLEQRVGDQKREMCVEMFTKAESDKALPSGISRLQTQI